MSECETEYDRREEKGRKTERWEREVEEGGRGEGERERGKGREETETRSDPRKVITF